MRTDALERLRPVCLACRAAQRPPSPLKLGHVARRDGDDIIEGVLVCSTQVCQRENPIIDGIPIIVADPVQFLRDHEGPLLARTDLTEFSEGVISDSLGTDSSFGYNRSTLSSYAYGQYEMTEGLRSLIDTATPMLAAPPNGIWLDTGCATAGGCFELAARGAELVLGIDINIAMLRFARRLIRDGKASYALRKSGVVYEQRTIEVDDEARQRIEVWACSATALPFYDDLFDGALSCNVVDSVDIPIFHLAEMGRVLRSKAEAIIASPYDWSTKVTELHRWIGGHSQRSDSAGSSVAEMQRLLSDASPADMNIPLRITNERQNVPWTVYMHERASARYQTHLIIANVP